MSGRKPKTVQTEDAVKPKRKYTRKTKTEVPEPISVVDDIPSQRVTRSEPVETSEPAPQDFVTSLRENVDEVHCEDVSVGLSGTVLCIGDLHFRPDTLYENEQFSQQVMTHLQTCTYACIVIMGDVLHSHEKLHTMAMNCATKFIKMCSGFAPTFVLVGNHDATSNTIFCTEDHWMNVLKDIHNVHIIDKPHVTSIGGASVLFCPYVSDGRFKESLELFAGGIWKTCSCIFAHQLFDGAKMGGIVATDVETWNTSYPTIISGHVHDKQVPQPNLIYVGSSQQHSFGDSDDKSLACVTISPDGCLVRDVYIHLQKKAILRCSLAEVESIAAKLKPNVQYKIVIEDEDSQIKSFRKTSKSKTLEKLPGVKSVQYKAILSPLKGEEERKEKHMLDDFLTLLQVRVTSDADPYLRSYADHLLFDREDQSDKDVLLL